MLNLFCIFVCTVVILVAVYLILVLKPIVWRFVLYLSRIMIIVTIVYETYISIIYVYDIFLVNYRDCLKQFSQMMGSKRRFDIIILLIKILKYYFIHNQPAFLLL